MPVSKKYIALITVSVVIVLVVCIWAAVFFSKKSTITQNYECVNGTCLLTDSGIYTTLSACQTVCTSPAPAAKKYECVNGACSMTNTGTFVTSADCKATCIANFNCDGSKGCVQVTAPGTYVDNPTCTNACQKYSCNSNKSTCNTPSTTFQDINLCNTACASSTSDTYNCAPDTGCVKPTDGTTGFYATSALCTANCQKLGCDSNGKKCNVVTTTYQDLPNCTTACASSTSDTYNCAPDTGCAKATAPSVGFYATSALCTANCKQVGCDSSKGTCTTASSTYQDLPQCTSSCTITPPVTGCNTYRVPNSSLNKGVDSTLGTFTDAMSKTYAYPFSGVRVTYEDSVNGNTVVTGDRMIAYVGDWVDSGASLFGKWASTYGISPTYSITGTSDIPFLYVPQLGTVPNIASIGNNVYDPSVTYANDFRTKNNIPGILIENTASGRSYRVYMGQPPSMQASERFADNRFGYHNPTTANTDFRNSFYWSFRERTNPSVIDLDKVYISASTDLYSSYQNTTSNTCLYYQANVLSTNALSAKLWPNGPSSATDSLYVDFTDANPLNGEFGVLSGAGFQSKGMDFPNKNGPEFASILIKPNVLVQPGVTKNVLELRSYITYNANSAAFTVLTSGGLISSKKWASGRYEIRAKVGNRPGMVWAIWTFTAVNKLPSPMGNCGAEANCAECMNCTDYSTCCSLCSATPGTMCGLCDDNNTTPCKKNTDCSGSALCKIPVTASQCNCNQCETNPLPTTAADATCSTYDCSAAIPCSWDNQKGQCNSGDVCAKYKNQNDCNNSGPCQGTLSWKDAAPPIGILTPWGAAETPKNIFYVGAADINDATTAGSNYQTAVATSVSSGAILGGMPCSSYYNMEIDFCEIPSNAPFYSNATAPPPDQVRNTAHTANLNTYRFTNSAGTGTYTNYAVEAQKPVGANTAQPFIGDGCFHTYAYEWHTGDPAQNIRPKVDAFFDGDYIGTSDSFVPDVFSRLWIVSWNSANPHWNGSLGKNSTIWSETTESPSTTVAPTTGFSLYNVNYIDYIRISPFNEANDKFVPDPLDQQNLNQVLDPSQVGMDVSTGKVKPGGSGIKPASCCALVKQPSPYDGKTTVDQCVSYPHDFPVINWTAATQPTCNAPLKGDTTAPSLLSQSFVPFFQTKTAITTADQLQGFGVVWDASSNSELTPSGGGGGGNPCESANVTCTVDQNCLAYTKTNCTSNCSGYCKTYGNPPHTCSIHCPSQ